MTRMIAAQTADGQHVVLTEKELTRLLDTNLQTYFGMTKKEILSLQDKGKDSGS